MTGRQSFLRRIYPFIMGLTRLAGKYATIVRNEAGVAPRVAFSSLTIVSNKGDLVPMSRFEGKKLLLVNTASDCGYAGQFAELQKLQQRFPALVIIGFPSNDFMEQEKGTDAEIAKFCHVNYGVSFMLAAKSSVIEGPQQNHVFHWLTDPASNGWNKQLPEWNFSKFLVNEAGELEYYFGPAISPLSKEVVNAVK